MSEKFPTFLGNWHQFWYTLDNIADSVNVIDVCSLFFVWPANNLFRPIVELNPCIFNLHT